MYYACVCTCICVHSVHGQNKEFSSVLSGIVKREYRSKNCVLFENVFFLSHVINRRRAPITKSPIFFVFVSTLSIYI